MIGSAGGRADMRIGDIEQKGSIMAERKITMKGDPLTLCGGGVKVGDKAPDFEVTANDLSPVKFSSFSGKVCILSVVPSLDTSVCDTQTRTFNEKASGLSDDLVVLTISMDLPFAQARWCGAAGIDRVVTVSDFNAADFGTKYGMLIKEVRLLGRAVIVVDKSGKVCYVETVEELTTEPNYDAALAAAKEALN